MRIVTICTDKPGLIKSGRKLHGLDALILADPELRVIDQFGLRNHGVNIRPPGVPGLPVPTSMLVDADGVVRWMDQSEHYSQRSDTGVIRSALADHFPATA